MVNGGEVGGGCAGVKGEVHQRGVSKFPKQPIAALEKGECLDWNDWDPWAPCVCLLAQQDFEVYFINWNLELGKTITVYVQWSECISPYEGVVKKLGTKHIFGLLNSNVLKDTLKNSTCRFDGMMTCFLQLLLTEFYLNVQFFSDMNLLIYYLHYVGWLQRRSL